MGTTPGEVGVLDQRAELHVRFIVTDRALHIRVGNTDATLIASAAGDVMMQRRVDKGQFREALWAASQIALEKAQALSKKSEHDDDLCSSWTAQRCTEELLRLLELGIEQDRKERGLDRAIDPEGLGVEVIEPPEPEPEPAPEPEPELKVETPVTRPSEPPAAAKLAEQMEALRTRPEPDLPEEPEEC